MVDILIIFTVIITLYSIIPWVTHILMVRGGDMDYGWASYKTFKREFNKYEWSQDGVFEDSLFDHNNGCKIHASIYKFANKGMIMFNPIDYYRSVMYIQKYCKTYRKPKRKLVDWNKID